MTQPLEFSPLSPLLHLLKMVMKVPEKPTFCFLCKFSMLRLMLCALHKTFERKPPLLLSKNFAEVTCTMLCNEVAKQTNGQSKQQTSHCHLVCRQTDKKLNDKRNKLIWCFYFNYYMFLEEKS